MPASKTPPPTEDVPVEPADVEADVEADLDVDEIDPVVVGADEDADVVVAEDEEDDDDDDEDEEEEAATEVVIAVAPVVVARPQPGRPPGAKDEPPPPFAIGERVVLIQNTRPRTGTPIGEYSVGSTGQVETVLSLTAIVRFDSAPDTKEVVAFTSLESAEPPAKKARITAAAPANAGPTGEAAKGGAKSTPKPPGKKTS